MTPGLENAISETINAIVLGYAVAIGFVLLAAFLARGGGE